MQAWLFLISGNAYVNSPANTLEEPLSKKVPAKKKHEKLRKGDYSLPYNFAIFGHQPTTREVVAFQEVTKRCAKRFIQDQQSADFEQMTHVVCRERLKRHLRRNGATTHRCHVVHKEKGEKKKKEEAGHTHIKEISKSKTKKGTR